MALHPPHPSSSTHLSASFPADEPAMPSFHDLTPSRIFPAPKSSPFPSSPLLSLHPQDHPPALGIYQNLPQEASPLMAMLCLCPRVIFQKQHLVGSLLCLKPYRGSALLGTQTLLKQILDPCQPCLLPFTAREPDAPQRQPVLTSHPSCVSMPSLCQQRPSTCCVCWRSSSFKTWLSCLPTDIF